MQTGTQFGENISTSKWLKENKLEDKEHIFIERDITIEELCDFESQELADFAKDIGLDTLARKRFVRGIEVTFQTNLKLLIIFFIIFYN